MPVTAVRDEGALRMWVCRLPVHIDLAGCTGFYGNLRRIRMLQRLPLGSRGAGPQGLRGFERHKFRSTLKFAADPLRLGFAEPPPLTARSAARGGVGEPRQIRTALQILNAKRFFHSHSNAAAIEFVVP